MSADSAVFDPDSINPKEINTRANSIRSSLVNRAINTSSLNPLNDVAELEAARQAGIGELAKTLGKKGIKYVGNIVLPGAGSILTSKKFWIVVGVVIFVFILLLSTAAYRVAHDNPLQTFFACGLGDNKKCVEEVAKKASENVDKRSNPKTRPVEVSAK